MRRGHGLSPFQLFLKTAAGSPEMAVDGTTPALFLLAPTAAQGCLFIHSLIFSLRDTTGFQDEGFGDGAALTNGVTLEVQNAADDELIDLLDGLPIKKNADFGVFCDSVASLQTTTNGQLTARMDFGLHSGGPLVVPADHRLLLTVSDNLTGMLSFNCLAKGQVGPSRGGL
jgi:hypothetical protein